MAKRRKSYKVNVGDYQEGMPCHRYILRNLKTEVDALNFVKTFVNTMTHVKMEDSQIEACIYLFSAHLPPDSAIKGYQFENWPNALEDVSLVDSIRLDATVATFKRCVQFYKSQTAKTDVCKICPLSDKYCNGKKDIESYILRYALESKENYEYVISMGVTPSHFHSLVDVLERVTTALLPGLYPFYADVFRALGMEHIADEHFESVDKTVPCSEMEKFISKKISTGSIPSSITSSPVIDRVVYVLWDEIIEYALKTREEIHAYICALLSNKNIEVADCTSVAEASDIGKDAISDYYATSDNCTTVLNNDADESQYEHISVQSVMERALSEDSKTTTVYYDAFSEFSVFDEEVKKTFPATDDISQSSVYGEDSLPDEEEREETGNFYAASYEEEIPVESEKLSEEPAAEEHNDADEDVVEEEVVKPFEESVLDSEDKDIFHGTESGEMEIREIPIEEYNKEIYEEEGSMVSVPYISTKELRCFSISLDGGDAKLLTIFESHVLKDKQLCMELVQTEKGLRYFLFYSPRLHAYFYTNMSDRKVYGILKSLLSHSSIVKYCYYPFCLVAATMKFDIYIQSVVSIFSLSCIKTPGHTFSMEYILESYGAKKAVGGVTVKPEGEIESLPILYMHSYPNIYRRLTSELKGVGLYGEYVERNQFDVLLSRFFYQDLYEAENRSLFVMNNTNRYVFADAVAREYKEEGRCYNYRISRCVNPTQLVRKVLLLMDSKGYFKKYHMMISSLTPISFTLYVANADCDRIKTLVHIALLDILMLEEYRNVEYELIEIK